MCVCVCVYLFIAIDVLFRSSQAGTEKCYTKVQLHNEINFRRK